jgi:hypothetical protein
MPTEDISMEAVMRGRLILAGPFAVAVVLANAIPALADHTHFRIVGDGECVLLAVDGGEKDVQLPHADDFAANRQHPLHVNVHLGQPGEVGQVYVAYAADGVLTPEAEAFCGGTFVNG